MLTELLPKSTLQSLLILSLMIANGAAKLRAEEPDFLIPPVPGTTGSSPGPLSDSQLQAAERELRAHLKRNPDDDAAIEKLAVVLVRQKKYQEAIFFLRGKHLANPGNRKVALLIGQVYLEAGLVCDAVDHFEWMERQMPDTPDLRY